MEARKPPVAIAAMLIRKPVAEVYEAFVDPAITSQFWFSTGSGRLEAGKTIRWDWDTYGVSAAVKVHTIERNSRILVDWGADDAPSMIEWTFNGRPDGTTFVEIANWGFVGEAAAEEANGSTEGFTLVLAGAKALLEHGVRLNLVPDRFPDGLEKHPK